VVAQSSSRGVLHERNYRVATRAALPGLVVGHSLRVDPPTFPPARSDGSSFARGVLL
jgi:hypothetical protein